MDDVSDVLNGILKKTKRKEKKHHHDAFRGSEYWAMTGHIFGILLQSGFPGCILEGVAFSLLLAT